jgi:hypothetical protein
MYQNISSQALTVRNEALYGIAAIAQNLKLRRH